MNSALHFIEAIIKREDAQIDERLKEVAPSRALREWFGHQPERWELFRRRYSAELRAFDAFAQLKTVRGRHKTVTLLYAAKDEKHNHALIRQEHLQAHGKKDF